MDRNFKQVDRLLRRNLVDPIAHRDCLAVFADSIEKLHQLAPGNWSTYCEGTKPRLVGGSYIVLTFTTPSNRSRAPKATEPGRSTVAAGKGGRLWITLDQHALEANAPAGAHLMNAEGVEF